jgi:hypothetical protein
MFKQSMRYYLSRYLRKPGHEEYLPLSRIEDLFDGITPMLSYLVDDLVHRGKKNEAFGICMRHNLFTTIREDTLKQIAGLIYDPMKDAQPEDNFGPYEPGKFISLPSHIKVEMISKVEDISKLNNLFSEEFLGVDSEWRPALAKFHNTKPALF